MAKKASAKKTAKTTKGSASQIAPTRVVSKQLSEDELLNTSGATGTYIVNGFLESDYNSKLAGTVGLELYDEMRKSDSKVRQSLMVCMLPILSTEWYFEPAQNPETYEVGEAEQEVSDFCEKALFEKMEITWLDYLSEVLTLLPFGFSLFEKTYTADEYDDHVWIKTLGYRKQTTIEKWETMDGMAGVTQQLPSIITDPDHPNFGQSKVSIPSGKLLLFSYQKEGDNYAGVSVLRSAYKHWYIKDALYKFDTIKHERQGVGIPVIKLPKNHTEKDKLEAKLILKNVRANEQGGVVLPEGWEFMFADLQAGNTTDIWKSIEHHNQEIANNVLAMFLNLVSGDGGSRALSEDQSDFFLLSLEALANLIEDVHNRFLIPELVDFNYDVENYPKLRHRKLGNVAYGEMATTLGALAGAGIINPDDDLEDWMRKLIDAPPRMPEDELEEDDGEEEIDPLTGLPVDPTIDESTIEEVPQEELTPEEQEAQDAAQETIDNLDASDDERTDAAYRFMELQGKAMGFRIVSEATKRKISEALKGKKRGGKIADARAKRLARRGIKDSAKRQAGNKTAIQDTLNQAAKPVQKKRTKIGNALKQIAISNKGKGAKKKKKPAAPKRPKVKSSIKRNVAKRKAARIKKLKAHDHTDPVMDKYHMLFAEGAKGILDIQRNVEFTKGKLPQGPRKFSEGNKYKAGWRALTFAEQKVDWKSLRKSVSKFESALNAEMDDLLGQQKQDLLNQVKKAVESNDIASVGILKARFTGDISSALGNVQKEMFELGKTSVALEMGVNAPGTAKEIMGAIKVNMGKMVKQLTDDVENAVSSAVSQLVGKNAGSITNTQTAQAIAAASDAIDKAHEARSAINTLTLYGSLNLGRSSIFERYPEQIYGFQFSAIIDDKTTDVCLSLDGRVVKVGDADFYRFSPPLHYGCRSLFVEILNDEEFKPEETGIPARIPSSTTIDGFKDLTIPVVEANSPAVKVLQQELDERLQKIQDLQESGLYPNRLAAHQQRVDQLKLAIADDATKIALPKEIKLADGTTAATRTGYLYHSTPATNIKSIAEDGLQPRVTKMDEGTKVERVYLTPIPDLAGSGISMDKGTLLRVRADLASKPEQDPHIPVPGGSVYTTHGFDPKDLEVQQSDGSWKPLVDSE